MNAKFGLRRAVLGLIASAAVVGQAWAGPADPKAGVEYRVLAKPQPAEGGNKVEVIEFFGYFCPHCYALEPLINEWKKKNSDKIVFKRVHPNMGQLFSQQKLYYTLDAMNLIDKYHQAVFNAFHVDRNRLMNDNDVMKFVAKAGIDKKKFTDTYESFAVKTNVNRADQLADIYRIDGVPTMVVDGRFITSPVMAVTTIGRVTEDEQNRAGLQVLDHLIAKILKERGVSGAKPAATNNAATPVKSK